MLRLIYFIRYPAHIIIFFDFNKKEFKIKGLSAYYHNENFVNDYSEATVLNNLDKFGFACKSCYAPHIFVIQFPRPSNEVINFTLQDLNHNSIKESSNDYSLIFLLSYRKYQ